MKDIDKYWKDYQKLYSYEKINLIYREKKLLEILNIYKPKNILEIGCGFSPICFKYLDYNSSTLIEPGSKAYEYINSFFEIAIEKIKDKKYDFIICNGMMHEVEDPDNFLRLINRLLSINTKVYINVPNSNSLHRLLALKMSLLNSLKDKSSRNIKLYQITNFDKKSLTDIISKNIPNLVIDKCSSFFLKPFTHDQMLKILETKIIDMNVIEALYLVSDDLPEYGAELYCLFSKNNN